MRLTTDPRKEIAEILNLEGFDCVYMRQITRGKFYEFVRTCDMQKIGTLEKENGEWVLDAWQFEIKGMEYTPVPGKYAYGMGMAWYAATEPVTTVKTAMAYFKGVAEKAAKVQEAKVKAVELFLNIVNGVA